MSDQITNPELDVMVSNAMGSVTSAATSYSQLCRRRSTSWSLGVANQNS